MCLIAGAEPVSGGKLCLGIDLQHMLKMLAQEGTCAGVHPSKNLSGQSTGAGCLRQRYALCQTLTNTI